MKTRAVKIRFESLICPTYGHVNDVVVDVKMELYPLTPEGIDSTVGVAGCEIEDVDGVPHIWAVSDDFHDVVSCEACSEPIKIFPDDEDCDVNGTIIDCGLHE